jgi:hypothetical protein
LFVFFVFCWLLLWAGGGTEGPIEGLSHLIDTHNPKYNLRSRGGPLLVYM